MGNSHRGVGIVMDAYEIRLLNGRGDTILLYFTQIATEAGVRRRLADIRNVDYVKYGIWRGMTLLGEGMKEVPAEENGATVKRAPPAPPNPTAVWRATSPSPASLL
jgi:hypothetical protein